MKGNGVMRGAVPWRHSTQRVFFAAGGAMSDALVQTLFAIVAVPGNVELTFGC
jgi:hypothetical protein